jgi:two-component system chemotaxis response regulator CheY
MPVLDGLATLRALRSEDWGREQRVVMCTTENGIDQIVTAIEAGADEYIMKPYDADILGEKLRTIGLLT